jgi:predicted GH43/DUF377 family glycosyl hydrolase
MAAPKKKKVRNVIQKARTQKPKLTLVKKAKQKSKTKTKVPVKSKLNRKAVKRTAKKVVRKVAKKRIVRKGRKLNVRRHTITRPNLPLIHKFVGNPIMEPSEHLSWESHAVFNPAAILYKGRVHLFYRALGSDGVSRFGYASSKDGINFDDRLPYPVFVPENRVTASSHYPFTSPARLVYNTSAYESGGGWGGCEDPRAVQIDGRLYLTFNMFNGWNSMRVAFTSIDLEDMIQKKWKWDSFTYLSRLGDRQKNWVLFPEKINGKFAVFHNLDMGDPTRVHIAFLDDLNVYQSPTQDEAPDPHTLPDHIVAWHNRTRSAAAPPIKTRDGWLLFYHAMDKDDPDRYKVGALLLDLKDPTKVLYRSAYPVLEPDEWYENDWKPGIVYANGAVVKDGILLLYYGGGDKRIAVAYANLSDFLHKLKSKEHAVLIKKTLPLE